MPYFMTTSYKSIPDVDEDKYWDENWGDDVDDFIRPLKFGLEVNAKFFPQSGFLEHETAIIPNLFSIEFWFCTEVIKDAIEQLEPGRHRFHPFSLNHELYEPNLHRLSDSFRFALSIRRFSYG